MRAIYGNIVNVRAIPSRQLTRIEIDIPVESFREAVEFFGANVLVTVAPAEAPKTYGVIDSEHLGDPFDPVKTGEGDVGDVSQIATFTLNEREAGEIGRSSDTWRKLGPLCQSSITLGQTEAFRIFVAEQIDANGDVGDDDVAEYIRSTCGVESRKQLDDDQEAAVKFREMMAQYRGWINRDLPQRKAAGAR